MFLAWIANAGVLIFLVWSCAYLVRQRRSKARRQTRELMVSPLAGIALGAMLLGFQAVVQPDVRHMIVEMQKEDQVDDENGDGLLGGRLFHDQLRRIRNGEEVEELTVRIDHE